MSHINFESYFLPFFIVLFLVWRLLRLKKVRTIMPKLTLEGAIIVDVRSPAEFKQGACAGSLNIPLNEIKGRLNELDNTKTIVVCCASGSRSGIALGILKKNGFNSVVNAGAWVNTLDSFF